jgi:hypothetical protein
MPQDLTGEITKEFNHEDRTWLAKVTNALNQHWQRRNSAKNKNRMIALPIGRAASDKDAFSRTGDSDCAVK